METKFTNEEIVKEVTRFLIKKNDVWKKLYEGYAKEILGVNKEGVCDHLIEYEQEGKAFNKSLKSPFHLYSTFTTSKEGDCFDLRVLGKSVGKVEIKTKKIKLKEEKIKELFERGVEPNSYISIGDLLRVFKSNKIKKDYIQTKPKECQVESQMLNLFAELKGDNKPIKIQPVTVGNAFIQFQTPISASNHKELPHFQASIERGAKGGGIDILARIRHEKGYASRLAVIEIKDENKPSETQDVVMQQAIAYATFIAFLMRSDFGNFWWTIFCRNKSSKPILKQSFRLPPIDVISLMPYSEENKREGCLDELKIKIPGKADVRLQPYTLYYIKQEDGSITFKGTLLDE